jgi:TonB family protein
VVLVLVLGYFAFLSPRGPSQAEIQAQQELKKLQAQQAEMAEKMKTLEAEKNELSQQVTNAKTDEERKKAQKALDDAQKRLEAQQQEQARLATAAPPVKPPPGRTPQPVPTPVRGDQGSAPAPGPAVSTAPAAPPTTPSTSPAAPASPPPPEPAAAETTKVKVGDFVPLWAVDLKPKAQGEIKISVTQGARQNHASGMIYVEVSIDETGKVSEAKIVKGLNPDYGMNDECQAAAAKVKYSPAVKDGVPVKTKMTFPIIVK